MKKLTKALLVLISLVALVGCSSSKTPEKGDGDITKLIMYLPGEKVSNHDEIMESVNKIAREEIGAELDLRFIGWGEFSTKINLWLSTGEDEFDIVTTGGLGTENFVLNAQKGSLADLTELSKTHAPDVLKLLDEAYIKGNTFNDKLYGIAVNANVYGETVVAVNGELLDKYNLSVDGITTYAGLEPLLKVIKENEPTVTPLFVKQDIKVVADLEFPISDNLPFAVDFNGDQTKVINPYEQSLYVNNLKVMRDFNQKGYTNSDASLDFPGWETDVWFAHQTETGPADYEDYVLNTAAGKRVELVRIGEPTKDILHSQMASLVIPKASKNQEKALEFINLLYTNKDMMTTLGYGMEGQNWEKIDDNTMKLTDSYDATKLYSPWNYGNKLNMYRDEAITSEVVESVTKKLETAKVSPMLGFTVDIESIKTEVANIQNVMEKYRSSLHNGTIDIDEGIKNLTTELNEAGYQKVLEEIQKQYDEFR